MIVRVYHQSVARIVHFPGALRELADELGRMLEQSHANAWQPHPRHQLAVHTSMHYNLRPVHALHVEEHVAPILLCELPFEAALESHQPLHTAPCMTSWVVGFFFFGGEDALVQQATAAR